MLPNTLSIHKTERRRITHDCKKRERVREATAADTILAAWMFSSPMFSASPATNCRASSPSISTEVILLGALPFPQQVTTPGKHAQIKTGGSNYLWCLIYADPKTYQVQTFNTKSMEAR
jgi:hypothetical protein